MLAFNLFAPIVDLVHIVVTFLGAYTHNYGWALIVFAAIVKGIFWPLNSMQYKSMQKMQTLAPQLKVLRDRYKTDKERLNTETMALYKRTGANPVAGCIPVLVQLPVIYSVYQAVTRDEGLYSTQSWLWVGSNFAKTMSHGFLGSSLAGPDYVLLILYMIAMYFSVRLTAMPTADPQQAQQQKIMSFISPAMTGYFGWKFHWPSALLIYWLAYNLFTLAQQMYSTRMHRLRLATDQAELTSDYTPIPSTDSPAKKAELPPKNSSSTRRKRARR